MQVTLDVFCGQPNPCWEVAAEDEPELARRLADLPHTDQAPVAAGLGYRGFVIENAERKRGFPAEVRVGGGVVTTCEGEQCTIAVDRHALELWLVDQARKRGFGDLIDLDN